MSHLKSTHPRSTHLGLVGAILLCTLAISASQAAVIYWDINGKTAGAGGATPNGTWNSTNKNWSQVAAGNNSVDVWVAGSTAVFSAGTDATGAYTVTVSGTQSVGALSVEDGNPTLTGGTVNFSSATPDLTVNSGHTLTFGSALTSTTGNLNFSGGGTVSLTSNLTLAGTVTLGGGTLKLANSSYTLGTLNVTANSTIDFAGSTTLNLTNLNISAGVTLNIINWTQATDFFYATNWSGAVADTTGAAPMNQISFSGFAASNTQWRSYDHQITPVIPEPSTYGAALLGTVTALVAWRRRRI